MDLAKVVSCEETHAWSEGSWQLGEGHTSPAQDEFHVVMRYGCKQNILRLLADRGCRITVVPAQTSADGDGVKSRWRIFI